MDDSILFCQFYSRQYLNLEDVHPSSSEAVLEVHCGMTFYQDTL